MKKIAIIGGGIAGLTAGYLLHEKYDVSLFERSERLGGNAYTFTLPDGQDVDIAAAVFGRFSYRNLSKLFDRLKIAMVGPAGMNRFGLTSLGVGFCDLDTREGFFLTPGLRALFAQQFQVLRPRNVKSILHLMAGKG
jgi:predicted NAD/FAD-binding protein